MATNRPIVEVLHYVGATDSFVAGQFQRHFLLLGFRGGALGGGAAILMFGVVEAANSWLAGTAGGDQIAGLFGNLSIGVAGYLAIVLQIISWPWSRPLHRGGPSTARWRRSTETMQSRAVAAVIKPRKMLAGSYPRTGRTIPTIFGARGARGDGQP